ncbi:MAG: hypothetical protein K1X39_00220 [Thermoflexales bacterium]|nr:hypothetical protein [Thermoflexales bacterium]
MVHLRDFVEPIALLLAAFAGLLFVASFLSHLHARSEHYHFERKAGHERAHHLTLWGRAMLIVAAALVGGVLIVDGFKLDGFAGRAINESVSGAITASAITASPTPLPRATPLPTATPPPAPTRAMASEGGAAAKRGLALHALATGIDRAGLPTGVATTFTPEAPTILVFFDYRQAGGATVRHAWFRDGNLVYAAQQALPTQSFGSAVAEWKGKRPLERGRYEVRVSLDDEPAFVANFEVR